MKIGGRVAGNDFLRLTSMAHARVEHLNSGAPAETL